MPEKEQDMLSQALLDLEKELESFGGVQQALKNAHAQLTKAEKEWAELTHEQQKTAGELVAATKSAIAATQAVTAQAELLAGALIPLAKAIEQVNFPMRLDKIDMGISTQASTMASFHGALDRGFSGLTDKVNGVRAGVTEGFAAVKVAQDASRKRHVFMIVLLIINAAAVSGMLWFLVSHGLKLVGR